MPGLTIVPVDEPAPVPPELFDAWAEVYATSARHDLGDALTAWRPADLRAMRENPSKDRRRIGWAAVEGAEVVGAAELVMPMLDNPSMTFFNLVVLPGHRRRGVGSSLLRTVEGAARDHGRSVLVAETEWLSSGRDEGGEGFAARHGYAAAQTSVRGSLSLPADRARLEAALAGDGTDGYVARTCWDGIPKDWLAGRAELSRRMSTDVPLGDLRLEEEVWDEQRVRGEYDRITAMDRRVVDTFAVEEASGRLVGYTQVQVPRDEPAVAYQQDTLVMAEHRGHRLGLRMKAANALALMEGSPATTRVLTWNADDNAPMLAVNDEVGYLRDAYLREWQKVMA